MVKVSLSLFLVNSYYLWLMFHILLLHYESLMKLYEWNRFIIIILEYKYCSINSIFINGCLLPLNYLEWQLMLNQLKLFSNLKYTELMTIEIIVCSYYINRNSENSAIHDVMCVMTLQSF